MKKKETSRLYHRGKIKYYEFNGFQIMLCVLYIKKTKAATQAPANIEEPKLTLAAPEDEP